MSRARGAGSPENRQTPEPKIQVSTPSSTHPNPKPSHQFNLERIKKIKRKITVYLEMLAMSKYSEFMTLDK